MVAVHGYCHLLDAIESDCIYTSRINHITNSSNDEYQRLLSDAVKFPSVLLYTNSILFQTALTTQSTMHSPVLFIL